MRSKLNAAVAALAFAVTAAAADAATFNFSYGPDGNAFTGVIEGALQADNNTVIVSGVTNTAFAGVATPEVASVTSFTNAFYGTGKDPVVTVDGSIMDLTGFNADMSEGFGVLVDGDDNIYSASTLFGNVPNGAFDADQWSLTATTPVNLPAALPMLAAALGGLALVRRRAA